MIIGMTGSGKTGLGIALLEEAAIDGVPAIAIDPKGDLGNLLLTFPALAPADFRPWINVDDAARKNLSADDYAAQQATFWKEGLAGWGEDGDRIARFRNERRPRHLHPGEQRRHSLVDPAIARRAAGRDCRRCGAVWRAPGQQRQRPAVARRHRRRSREEPRAHPAVDDRRRRLEEGREPRARRAHPADSAASGHAHWCPRRRFVLPGEGPLRAGDADQRSARRARIPVVARRRAARHRSDAVHVRWQAADLDRLDRAPRRSRAHVHRRAHRQRGAGVDASPERDDEPAGAALRGRSGRLHAAGGEPAIEAGDAHAAQTGARIRSRRRPVDAEPRRSRLQGPVQPRHLDDRPAADRSRQVQGARGARRRAGFDRSVRSRRAGSDALRARQAHLPHAQRPRRRAGGVRDALDDVLPARSVDARSDPPADVGTIERGRRGPEANRGQRGDTGGRRTAGTAVARADPAGKRIVLVRPAGAGARRAAVLRSARRRLADRWRGAGDTGALSAARVLGGPGGLRGCQAGRA